MNPSRAVIDIGSNTVRLVIYGAPLRAPVVLLNEKVSAKLGKGVADSGELAPGAMALALSALGRFAAILRLKGITDVHVVATAAVRDASNGADFLLRVSDLGLTPRLLSGKEEARASALGVLAAFPGARGTVLDMGGGSLELVRLTGGAMGEGITLPFGSLRLPALRSDGHERFTRRVSKALQSAGWQPHPGEDLYLVGGSFRALANFALRRVDWPDDDPHGFELPLDAAVRLCRTVAQGRLPERIAGISASRLASLPATAALLDALLAELKPARLIFSSWGLREGLLHEALPPAIQAQDPLLAGVGFFAEDFDVAPTVAVKVAGWTAQAGPPEGAERQSVRLAATMLALAVQASEPNLRADEAVIWALRKRWVGISAGERAVMAAALLGNSGRKELPEALSRLAAQSRLREGVAWGLAIRLCRRLTALTDGGLGGSRLEIAGSKLVLTLDRDVAALFTEPVEKDLKALAEWLGLERVVDTAESLV